MRRSKPDPLAQETCHGFYADILHFLRKRTDNASDAADMTQDVFTQWPVSYTHLTLPTKRIV